MNKQITFLLGLFLFIGFCTTMRSQQISPQKDLADYVNTLQGTNSKFELTRGNTYPTTALPFGMNTWTPQTGVNGDGWKYQYFKDEIRGFQQAHQCSSWSNDYAVFSLMPEIGELILNDRQRGAKFSHENETAKPYYYQVKFNNNIQTEFSPTERGVHIRFSFPDKEKSYLVLDGYTGTSQVKVDANKNRITGYVRNGRGMHRVKGMKNYFIIQFDQSFKKAGIWENEDGTRWENETEKEGKGIGAWLQFKKGATVQAKIASSYISPEQAERNMQQELGGFNTLEDTKEAARQTWNNHLEKIRVEGGTEEELKTFYSCFFRASLFSRKFYEINENGNPYYYSPYDGTVHEGYMFTDTGFWDTFRGQFPLNAILYPEMHGRYVSALIDAYEQSGWLPSWSFPSEAGSMIGNHAISLLADAWAKGIRTFDPEKALEAYYHEATNKGPGGPSRGREGWKEYFTLGYVPYPEYREATAKTLEYAYDDFCGYTLAEMSNNDFYKSVFSRQMYNYRNVFDPSTGFMRGRHKNGEWVNNFDPYEWGGPYTEGNAWHYLWSVFQDPQGLINLMGGENEFNRKIDSVFSVPNKINVGTYGGRIHEMTEMEMAEMGQYAHGNQPIQHMIYLSNYSGQPWKTQERARTVMKNLYNSTENGYPGDEDQGQTSSWYVLSALGFYSVCPGTDQYVVGSPVFQKATITLENGNEFIIEAPENNQQNVYIQEAALRGNQYEKNYITYRDIMQGGRFSLDMTNTPNKERGVSASSKPFSLSEVSTQRTKTVHGEFELIINDPQDALDTELRADVISGLQNIFDKAYPKMVNKYNPKAKKTIAVHIDPSYRGVAYANGRGITISPHWLKSHPGDLDLFTHELMHIVQAYPRYKKPGWLTEGIADYVRDQFGIDNEAAGWKLTEFSEGQHYTNSYRITGRFLLWIEQNYDENFVQTVDKALREKEYTESIWEEETGHSLDELWELYEQSPEIS